MQFPRWDDTSGTYAWRHRQRLGRQFGQFWSDVVNNRERNKQEWVDWIQTRTVVPRDVNATMEYPAGYEDAPLVSSKPRVVRCTRVSGRNRPIALGSVVRQLMNEQTLCFQSLSNTISTLTNITQNGGYSWTQSGINPLNFRYVTGGPSTWPRTLACPVYLYRLSCSNGKQQNDTSGNEDDAYPFVQYRMNIGQAAVNDTWDINWVPVDPANGVRAASPTWNGMVPLSKEEDDFDTTRVYHESTIAKVLITGPTGRVANVNLDVVQFNDDLYAPVDAYYTSLGGTTQETMDEAAMSITELTSLSDYYSTWLFNKMNHPCVQARLYGGRSQPRPFTVLKRHSMSIGPRDTASGDVFGPQYLHTQVLREHRWHDTYNVPIQPKDAGPNVDVTGNVSQLPQNASVMAGVFPKRTRQKWLMVSSFGAPPQLGYGAESVAFIPNTEASFDISIVSKFKCVNH